MKGFEARRYVLLNTGTKITHPKYPEGSYIESIPVDYKAEQEEKCVWIEFYGMILMAYKKVGNISFEYQDGWAEEEKWKLYV